MFDVITKSDYWAWRDAGFYSTSQGKLKDIQDTFVLAFLRDCRGKRICEVGGGDSRVLRHLSQENECWLLDRFEGQGAGPKKMPEIPKVRFVREFLGAMTPDLPNDYFDVVFSVSVVEHVPDSDYAAFVQDGVRILRPGGLFLHAIDAYLPDADADPYPVIDRRLFQYVNTPSVAGGRLTWHEKPVIGPGLRASSRLATSSADTLYLWNKIAPDLRPVRETMSSCSLRMVLRKTE